MSAPTYPPPGGDQPAEPDRPNLQKPAGEDTPAPPPPSPGYAQNPPPQNPPYPPQDPYGSLPAPPPGGYAGPPMSPPPGTYGYPGSGLPLPPGVELASHGRRIGAYFLGILLFIVTLVIGYIIWGLILWRRGTSPALSVLGCKVVDANTGQPVGWGKMALRDIVGGIAQGILGGITQLVSFILFLSTAKRQSIPDLVGTTVVVYDPNNVLG